MWGKFVIFALLQVAVLNSPVISISKQDFTESSTAATSLPVFNTNTEDTRITIKKATTSTPEEAQNPNKLSASSTTIISTGITSTSTKLSPTASAELTNTNTEGKERSQQCTRKNECKTTLACINNVCICDSKTYWNDSSCVGRMERNQQCRGSGECKTSLACINKACICDSKTYWNDSSCVGRKDRNQKCIEKSECKASLDCINKECNCDSTTYWNGNSCVGRKDRNQQCIEKNECKASLDCINKECNCDSTTYWNGTSCVGRPPQPEFSHTLSDNSSFSFMLTVHSQETNGFRCILKKDGDSTTKTFRLEVNQERKYRIGNLTAGECYNVNVYSLINEFKSESSQSKYFCTHPNTPRVSVVEINTTAIVLLMEKGDGHLSSYQVCVNGKKFQNVTFAPPSHFVVNGTPGSVYEIKVSAVVRRFDIFLESSPPKTFNCSTAPSPPRYIEVTDQTTNSISLNITHGPGKVEYFEILQNGIYYSNVTAQTDGYTHMLIDDLIPGILYRNFAIIAVSNGVNSSKMKVREHGTEPSTPNVTITSETTDTIQIIITRGAGVVQKYNILMDGKCYKIVNVANNSLKTNHLIEGLHSGTAYTDFTLVAVSNDLNSTEIVIPPHATLPEKPLGINQQTSGLYEIGLEVTTSNKANQNVLLVIKDFRNNNVSTAEITSNRTHDGFTYTVSNLQIGTCYHLEVYSTFTAFDVIYTNPDGLKTSAAVCTLPKKPNSITQTKATLTSMTFDIGYNSSLNIDLIGITVVIRDMTNKKNISIICNRTIHRYTCTGNNFDVGNCYQACAYSVLNDTYLNRDTICIERACTLPKKPNSITQTKTTLTNITFDIGYNSSLNIDLIGITVVIRDMKNKKNISSIICNRTTHRYTCTGNNFDIGNCYQACAYSVLNDIYLNRDKVCIERACTLPKGPSSVKQSGATDNSVSLTVQSQYDGLSVKKQKQDDTLINCSKTDAKKTYSCYINELNIGSCYEMVIYTVLNNLFSDSNYSIRACTRPGKPLDIIQFSATIYSIVVNIKPNQAGLTNNIRLKSETGGKYNHTCVNKSHLFTCTLTALSTGECYNISAWAVLNNYESLESTMNESRICTRPSRPVVKFDRSTTYASNMSVSIYVETGEKDCYVIFLNGSRTSDASYNKDSKVTITNLEPGKYYQIQALAKLNGYESNKSIVTDGYTDPDRPSIQCVNSTTSIITISITKGDGGFDGYEIYVDPQWKNTYKAGKKQVQIPGRVPGTSSKVYGYAIANNIKSFKSHDIDCLTHPSPPKILRVDSRTNTTIILYIESGNGVVDSFLVLVNGSFHSKVNVDSSKTSITVPVSSLEAGTIYELRVKAASNNLNSTSSDLVINATYPSPPTSIRIIEMKKDSVTIEIVKGKGRVKRFVVSVNGRDINVPASLNKDATVYTISGLDSATTYPIKVSAVSSGAHRTELASIQMSLTTKKDPIPAAIGGVFGGCAALVVILIIVFSWRRQALCFKKNIQKEVEQGKMNAGFEEEVELEDNRRKRPIKVSEFHRHVEMMSGNSNMGFSQEFKELGILSPKHSTDVSQIQENRPKNRYTNILPFDHSRVKLIGIEDEPGSDFINANYIPGKKSKREFIATQGPLPSTKEEMWRMIWEQNVSSVVMLTQLIERGRKKCEIYWPENTNEKMFLGDIVVEVETLSHLSDYTLRTIALRLGDVERRINHYNYLSWPDMGTPKTSSNMINFVDTVRKEIQPNMNGPIIVHCSAGVGRTGTFIVMDILMQEIRSKCTHVDIFGTILNMRNYRLNMVQTEDQYVFIHNCVRDLLDVSDDEEEDRIEEQNAYLNEPIYQNVNE